MQKVGSDIPPPCNRPWERSAANWTCSLNTRTGNEPTDSECRRWRGTRCGGHTPCAGGREQPASAGWDRAEDTHRRCMPAELALNSALLVVIVLPRAPGCQAKIGEKNAKATGSIEED